MDSTQFKAKKTVFRQAERSENGQPVRVALDGFKCSTYQYLGHMQMKVSVLRQRQRCEMCDIDPCDMGHCSTIRQIVIR